jgi:hypothetical protein
MNEPSMDLVRKQLQFPVLSRGALSSSRHVDQHPLERRRRDGSRAKVQTPRLDETDSIVAKGVAPAQPQGKPGA